MREGLAPPAVHIHGMEVLHPQVSTWVDWTMSVGASHGSSLHGLALDLLFHINCMGTRSGRWILGGCMGHQYRQVLRVRGCVPFPHGPGRCRVFPEHCGFAEHGNKRQRTWVNTRRRVWCLCWAAHAFILGAPEGLNPLHQLCRCWLCRELRTRGEGLSLL